MKTEKVDVWYWGDDIEEAGRNSEKYIEKRWNEKIKEAEILVEGWFQDEDVFFDLFAYTSDPKKVGRLAESLPTSALELKDAKVDCVTLELLDNLCSEETECRNNMKDVEEDYEELKQTLIEKFKKEPRIVPYLNGHRTLDLAVHVCVQCESKSKQANKIFLSLCGDTMFKTLKDVFDMFTGKLIEDGLADEVVGYEFIPVADDYEAEEIDVNDEYIFILTRPIHAKEQESELYDQ